jgi:Raf kinase inhibitor-like YbhB/YbcL family protein
MAQIILSADAFKGGDVIPKEYTGDGQDVSPALSWRNVPSETKSLALIMEDPDAPSGTFTHWILFNLPPAMRNLPKGVPKKQTLEDGSVQGNNSGGRVGYMGPSPPPGKPHRYYFRLYALDTKLALSGRENRNAVLTAMKGHIIAQGEMMGSYRR